MSDIDTGTRPGPRIMHLPARLLADKRGASALEFGLVAAPFVALIVAVLETSLLFFAQQALDTAGQASARKILVGTAQKASWSKAQFKTYACTKLPTFMQCGLVTVDVQKVNSFATANTAPPTVTYVGGVPTTPSNFQPGAPGDIIMVRLTYPWSVAGGPLGFDLSNIAGSKRLLVSTSLARTEPYL